MWWRASHEIVIWSSVHDLQLSMPRTTLYPRRLHIVRERLMPQRNDDARGSPLAHGPCETGESEDLDMGMTMFHVKRSQPHSGDGHHCDIADDSVDRSPGNYPPNLLLHTAYCAGEPTAVPRQSWIEKAILFYQHGISPLKAGPSCRFEPTCSNYALTAVRRYGVLRGVLMAAIRLSKCGPWHPGGWDPVPPRRRPRGRSHHVHAHHQLHTDGGEDA